MFSDRHERELKLHAERTSLAIDSLFRFYNNDREPMPLDTVDQKGLDQALDCVSEMVAHGGYKNQAIGVIDPNIPKDFEIGNLRRGCVVLYTEEDNGTVTVEEPYCLEHIRKARVEGSIDYTHMILNVPKNLVRSIG